MGDKTAEQGDKLNHGRAQETPDLENDPFGHAAFAQHIAGGIRHLSPEEGLVLGIYGPWGSGKSTTLNYIKWYLKNSNGGAVPLTVDFRPWIFEGGDSLTLRFFQTLGAAIGGTKGNTLAGIAEKLGGLAEALSPISDIAAPNAKKIVELFKKNSEEQKEKLVQALLDAETPIIIFIDDVDRLTNQEIRDLFRLIKSVADFPNTTYVLAFDHAMVAKALDPSGQDEKAGAAFIEKIVQVPFELPMPSGDPLVNMLTSELDKLIQNISEERWDKDHWHHIFQFGARTFFKTPRDVIRFINTLKLTFPTVRDDVDPVDFIGIEALRVFHPKVYDEVRCHLKKLAPGITIQQPDSDPFYSSFKKQLKDNCKLNDDEQQDVEHMLSTMFPVLPKAWNKRHQRGNDLATKQKRNICHPHHAETYFRYSIPPNAISHAEIQSLLESAGDTDAFADILRSYTTRKNPDGRSMVHNILGELEAHSESIPPEAISTAVAGLFKAAAAFDLPSDRPSGLLFQDNTTLCQWTVQRLLSHIDPDKRLNVLTGAVSDDDDVAVPLRVMDRWLREHQIVETSGRGYDGDPAIPDTQVEALKSSTLDLIHAAITDGRLAASPDMSAHLYTWKHLEDPAKPTKWLKHHQRRSAARPGQIPQPGQ